MNDWAKLGIAALASLLFHFGLAEGLDRLPPHREFVAPKKVTIKVKEPPPEPPKEEEKPPEPPKPPPKVVHEAPRVAHPVEAPVQHDTPPPVVALPTDNNSDTPVFGTTMESTSTVGTGPGVPIGNTPRPEAGNGSAAPVKPLAPTVQAFEATKLPLPQGRCYGKYNDEALAAGIEGQVVLDIVVGEDGRVRDVVLVHGLGHGLDEAAIAAIRACRFSPGEKNGQAVAVHIKGFKITFVLPEKE